MHSVNLAQTNQLKQTTSKEKKEKQINKKKLPYLDIATKYNGIILKNEIVNVQVQLEFKRFEKH